MALPPIAPIGPVSFGNVGQVGGATGTAATKGAPGPSFADALTEQLDKLTAAHANADQLAMKAATGDLQAVQDYTIASTEAQLMTQLTVNIRNKAVEAFNDIMRMQV